jgi:hypothetical protein
MKKCVFSLCPPTQVTERRFEKTRENILADCLGVICLIKVGATSICGLV